jgi:hypothetical protein
LVVDCETIVAFSASAEWNFSTMARVSQMMMYQMMTAWTMKTHLGRICRNSTEKETL